MAIKLNRQTVPELASRLGEVRSIDQRRWGKLDPPGLMAHLNVALKASLGEVPVAFVGNPVSRSLPVRWFVLSPLPWPRGRIKAPDSATPPPGLPLDEGRVQVLSKLDSFFTALETDPTRLAVHPFFGPWSLIVWRRFHEKHFDHHLAQFGV